MSWQPRLISTTINDSTPLRLIQRLLFKLNAGTAYMTGKTQPSHLVPSPPNGYHTCRGGLALHNRDVEVAQPQPPGEMLHSRPEAAARGAPRRPAMADVNPPRNEGKDLAPSAAASLVSVASSERPRPSPERRAALSSQPRNPKTLSGSCASAQNIE
ncbi:hypothetical protein CH63R_09069 [Colletotrichum higginsianum IMI 349063]|uniref:Uncharacterized protein n=1 Tax=Colletotrichum higginsianum (strain IMI 349063) TaxID=759273 RepID=A0A1B7Y6F4_COLHI|nr:hypothetical protein CH63R_09069 [Colletotrichum higginsianum IMI 349063]OBR07548.1 hypothetical protein CH63R_09069 [Colletotrichum higginsianum IMI 349063]